MSGAANDALPIGLTWRKSSHSGKNGNCVELAWLSDGRVAIRNSRNPHGEVLIHHPDRLAALLAKMKGEV